MTYTPLWHLLHATRDGEGVQFVVDEANGLTRERQTNREAMDMREMQNRHRTISNTRNRL